MTVEIKKIMGISRAFVKKISGIGNDPYTKSLLHFNGTNGSTTFTDETGKTWTASGDAKLTTTYYAFPTASLELDGTGDSISTPNSTDFDFGTGNWTIDFWIMKNSAGAYAGMISSLDGSYNGMSLSLSSSGNNLTMTSNWSGGGANDIISATTVPDMKWTHVALVRYGNTITYYQDGTNVGSVNCTGWICNSAGLGLSIGRNFITDSNNYLYKGRIDEFRLSKGIARWTGNFTPPNLEYRMIGIKKFSGVSNT